VLEVVNRSGLGERLGRVRMLFTLEQAVDKYQKEYGTPLSSTEKGAGL